MARKIIASTVFTDKQKLLRNIFINSSDSWMIAAVISEQVVPELKPLITHMSMIRRELPSKSGSHDHVFNAFTLRIVSMIESGTDPGKLEQLRLDIIWLKDGFLLPQDTPIFLQSS